LKKKQPTKQNPKHQSHEAWKKSNKVTFILRVERITATFLRYQFKL